jgi:CBS domain-containing protein
MSTPVVTVGIDDDVARANEVLQERQFSAVLVVDKEGRPAGVISRRDLLRAGRIVALGRGSIGEGVLELPAMAAADLMSRPAMTVRPSDPVVLACRLLVERHIHRVFVVDEGMPAGVFSTRDVMVAVREARLQTTLASMARRAVISVEASAPVSDAVDLLERAEIGGVVVLEQNAPVGLFTEREALEARGVPPGTPTEEVMMQALLCLPGNTPLFRAAGFAMATSARRILVTDHHHPRGVVTGIDFARAVAENQPGPESGLAAG